jgi:hypothetical protein
LKQLSLKGKVIHQINLKAVKHSRHTLVLHHHAERQQSPGYSPLVVRCVTDAGVEAADMANGDNPNDGPCPFPDVSWLGAGSDAKLPTTTFMGEAARSKPATLPPMTRPSAHAKETLNPPVRWRFPPLGSGGKNEPIKERIS